MATASENEARIKELDWNGLRDLWQTIRDGKPSGWTAGKALEYLVIRAFQIDPEEPAQVTYPYEVRVFKEMVEQLDGALHLKGLSCLVESKDWASKLQIEPIAKLRNQLMRRPAGTVGLMFSRRDFTEPARTLAHFTLPQAILLWSGSDLEMALEAGRITEFLRLKYRICCERGIPDYALDERT